MDDVKSTALQESLYNTPWGEFIEVSLDRSFKQSIDQLIVLMEEYDLVKLSTHDADHAIHLTKLHASQPSEVNCYVRRKLLK